MPRAKIIKKDVEEVVENGRPTKKKDEKKDANTKKTGRGAKKPKENVVEEIESPVTAIKPKTGRGQKKQEVLQNGEPAKEWKKAEKGEDLSHVEVVESNKKPKSVRGQKKKETLQNGEAKKETKRAKKAEELPEVENIVEESVAPVKPKAERKQKKQETLQNSETTDQPKGRKRKAVATPLEDNFNNEKPAKSVAAKKTTSKKGATSKANKLDEQDEVIATTPVIKETPKKESKKVEKPKKRTKRDEKPKNDEMVEEEIETAPNEIDEPHTSSAVATKKSADSKKPASRKRAAAKIDIKNDNEEEEGADPKPSKAKKPLLNSTETKYNKADFELSASLIADGNSSNTSANMDQPRSLLKISSWNVAGLRSWIKKDGLKFLEYEEPDIFCMQEIKCTMDQLPEEAARYPGYHPYWLCLPGGYAGVALYSKIMPINVEYGIGNEEFDDAGRLITAEYEKFFLVNVYVPNSGRKLVNLEARMRWEKLFQAYITKLDARKPVIIAGDMNVSHNEIDLANPKSNTRSAGFTKEEREKMTELLNLGYIDTFRNLYPEKRGAYTYWTYMSNARARNIGWRLDYFIVSERINKRVVENAIRSQCLGSDHCPITLFINM